MPRWIDVERVTFQYGLGKSSSTSSRRSASVARPDQARRCPRRQGLAARRGRRNPAHPAELGPRCRADVCGIVGARDRPQRRTREVYVYSVVDTRVRCASSATSRGCGKTAVMPAVAIELMRRGVVGIARRAEALPAQPFLDLLDDHGTEWSGTTTSTAPPLPRPATSISPDCLRDPCVAPLPRRVRSSGNFAGVGERWVRESVKAMPATRCRRLCMID